ncbi:hypothetical protein [Sanguibacter suaedae]|uniref:Uncharacterized protein n=1 Tax=Sanguibacter suaedae TaxID=2795737 RepID=A0A934MB79_9MICO|nr:hypothetical protein [Sanguibacter suaedae]MBI9115031.1 hypothetical protein [Sanguibacter suaedae]
MRPSSQIRWSPRTGGVPAEGDVVLLGGTAPGAVAWDDDGTTSQDGEGAVRRMMTGARLVHRLWGALGGVLAATPERCEPDPGPRPGGEPPSVGDAARHTGAFDALAPDDRAAVDAVLARVPGERHREWVLAARAAGSRPAVLGRFADRIAALGAGALPGVLDPTSAHVTALRTSGGGRPLRQSTATTCGSAALVVAWMLADPVRALRVLDGFDATTGTADPAGATADGIASRFRREELEVQARTASPAGRSSGSGSRSRVGVPWPRSLGTAPWGASREMTDIAGDPRTRYRVVVVDPGSAAQVRRLHGEVVRAVGAGLAVPLYTGSEAVPRHVVLAVGQEPDGRLRLFDPATGGVTRIGEDGLVAGGDGLRRAASWPRLWAAIVPRAVGPADPGTTLS